MRERLIIAGFGGQGVMTLGKLAAAAIMREGKNITVLPAYGAEVRGGTAYCHLVISDEPIYSPIVEQADSLIILNQLSYDRFRKDLKPGGFLLLNSSAAKPNPELEKDGVAVLNIPATETADQLGNVRTANIIALGAYCARKGFPSEESVMAELAKELASRPHLLDVNRKAFQKGRELAG